MKIGQSDVDVNHTDIKACKSIDDLKKLEIFTDESLYSELWDTVKLSPTEELDTKAERYELEKLNPTKILENHVEYDTIKVEDKVYKKNKKKDK